MEWPMANQITTVQVTVSFAQATPIQNDSVQAISGTVYLYGPRGTRYRQNRSQLLPNAAEEEIKQWACTHAPVEMSSPIEFFQNGVKHLLAGDIKQGIHDFTKAIELEPNFASAYANRGTALNMIDRFDESIQDFDAAIRIHPAHEEALFGRGIAHMHGQNYSRAVEDFTACIKLNENKIEIYIQRALALYQLENYRRADSDIDEALSLDSTSVEANFSKGVISISLGEHERALDYLSRAIDLDCRYAPAYLTRGALLKFLGCDKWIDDQNRARELDSAVVGD